MALSTCLRRVRPGGLLLLMVAFYAAVALAVAVHLAWRDRVATLAGMARDTAAATSLLEERTNHVLDVSEQVAQQVAARIASAGLPALSLADLTDPLESAPFIANIVVTDPSGLLVAQGRGGLSGPVDLSAKDWVRSLHGEGTATVIGAAAPDEGSRTMAFAVARSVRDKAGRPSALVAVLVDVAAFQPLLRHVDEKRSAMLGVAAAGGMVLVRQPWHEGGNGLPFGSEALKAGAGHLQARFGEDGIERVVAYRTIAARGLVVWMAERQAEALAGWRRRAWGIAALTSAGIAIMVALSLLLRRELKRERRASADLITLNRDLERSNADLEQFAYVASHDLKEPLRNIASYVQLLQRRYQGRLDADADAFIGYTVDGVRRLQSIINELLAYSRIGTSQLAMGPVQAGALVSTALAHLKGAIAEAQAAVEVKGPLPVVEADAAQLGSLFQNLIANALKYRREDVRPEVTIGCEDRGGTWAFYVRDNGIGIDPQYHRQIFELFKRLHPRDSYPGTGIGLAACQRVVERHGGRIWVESAAGRGSTFWFSLPKHSAG